MGSPGLQLVWFMCLSSEQAHSLREISKGWTLQEWRFGVISGGSAEDGVSFGADLGWGGSQVQGWNLKTSSTCRWIPQGAEVTAEPSWECHTHVLSQDGQSQIPKPWILTDFTDLWFCQHLPFFHQILLPVPPPSITSKSCNSGKQAALRE